MTERYSETDDYRTFDGLEVLNHSDFKSWATSVNKQLRTAYPEERPEIIASAEEDFVRFFPHIDETEFINIVAMAYRTNPDDGEVAVNAPKLIGFDDAKYAGLAWADVDQRPQLAIGLNSKRDLNQPAGGSKDLNIEKYLVLPDKKSINNLDMNYLSSEEPTGTTELISRFTDTVATIMISDEYERASDDQRRQMLANTIQILDSKLQLQLPYSEIVDTYNLQCRRYFMIPNNVQIAEDDYWLYEFKPEDDELFDVSGDELTVILPELVAPGIRNWQNLSISGGVPYIAVEDFDKNCTYWVSADQMTAMNVTTIEEEDDGPTLNDYNDEY